MLLNLELWVRILLAVAIAFAISFAATPVVKAFATKMGCLLYTSDAADEL